MEPKNQTTENPSVDLFSIEPYSTFLANRGSENTKYSYMQDLRVLYVHFLKNGIKNPETATSADMTKFAASLAQTGNTPTGQPRGSYSTRSIKRILAAVRSFYGYLAAIQRITSDPTACFRVLHIRPPKRNPRPLPPSARRAIFTTLKTDTLAELQISLTIRLGFECGLRVSEIANLKVRDIQTQEDLVTVIGKGDKERTVPMTQETRKLVQKYLNERQPDTKLAGSPYLFCSPRYPLKPINPHFLETWVKTAGTWAGLDNAQDLTVHVLRHTFGTCLAEAGASAYEIRDLMGHSSISVSESYVQMASHATRDAHRKAFGAGYKGYALELAAGLHGGILRAFRKKKPSEL